MNWVPASPAPKTMIRSAVGAGGRDRSRAAKATYRAPSIAATANEMVRALSGSTWRPPPNVSQTIARQNAVSTPATRTARTSSRLPRR